jgi:hypothetical protein
VNTGFKKIKKARIINRMLTVVQMMYVVGIKEEKEQC